MPLKKCVDEEAYIEVGLRATESKVDNRKTNLFNKDDAASNKGDSD